MQTRALVLLEWNKNAHKEMWGLQHIAIYKGQIRYMETFNKLSQWIAPNIMERGLGNHRSMYDCIMHAILYTLLKVAFLFKCLI